MKTVPLNPNLADTSHAIERSEEAAICGEIARHLLDLRESTSAHRALAFISKLYAISSVEPAAFWLVVRIMSGDMSELTRSYSELGKQRGCSKQGAQQLDERVLRALHGHFPEIERAIVEMRGIRAGYLKAKAPQTETRGDRMSYQ